MIEKSLQKKIITRLYFRIFQFLAKKRLEKSDLDVGNIHSILISVITTAPLMWSHALLFYWMIPSKLLFWLGFFCSLLHASSVFLFRFTSSPYAVIDTMLFAGVTFISVTTYLTGGFHSFALLWIISAPMLGSISSGRRGAILWAFVSIIIIMTFFILSTTGYECPDLLTPQGHLISNYLLVFGWMLLASVLSLIFVVIRETSEEKLTDQTQKVDALFRVLFHDLANSIGRINIGHTIAKRENQYAKGMKIAESAADSMFEITQNVRKMYAVSMGKADLELTLEPLNESIAYVTNIFAAELEKKKITFQWDIEKLEGLKVLVEPISFKNQVLANILSNCIKFSPVGSVIKIAAYPSNHHYYTVEIKDSGIGMPEAILDNLFDLNKKTSRPGTNGEYGTGFGMHIMKSFVEIYQGEVKVESKECVHDPGTTFKLLLKGEWA
jgi:signal transduction histidine kinase